MSSIDEARVSTLRMLEIVKRGCDELLVETDFVTKLHRFETHGKPLRIKLGLDPTAPDLHLGHTVVLNKMRQLQDLGPHGLFPIRDAATAPRRRIFVAGTPWCGTRCGSCRISAIRSSS